MNNNDYWTHFKDNYDWNTDQLPFPNMIDFVRSGFLFPAIEKRPTIKSFKQQMLERKAEDDRIKTAKDGSVA